MRFGRVTNTLIYVVLVAGVVAIGFLYWRGVGYQEGVSARLADISPKKETSKPKPKEIRVVEKKETKIGFVTDAHGYVSKDDLVVDGWKLNWRAREPMEDFAKKMNEEFMPDFVVEGGDFVDGKDKKEMEAFIQLKEVYETVQAPKHYVLGNHEMKQLSVDDWLGLTGYERPYYFFDMNGYRFIVLDGNYRPTLEGGIEHTKSGSLYYPGLVGGEQLEWLRRTLQGGTESGLSSVIFVHQPPIGTDYRGITMLFENGSELQKIFTENKVHAVFSGHIERLCNMEVGGVNYYVLKGFWKGNRRVSEEWEFRNAGIFSEITLREDGTINVDMYHRTREERVYNLMNINQESANCLDGKMFEEKESPEETDPEDNFYTEE